MYAYTENDPLNGVDLSGLDQDSECASTTCFSAGGGGGGGGGGGWATVYTFTGETSGQDYGSIISYDGGAGADAAAANGGVVGTIPSGAYGISLTSAGNVGYSLDGGGSGSEGSPLTVIGGLIRTGIVTAPEATSPATSYQIASSSGLGSCNCYVKRMLVTGYDNSFQSTGKRPGDPGYGVTADGATASHGTIAAPHTYPFGTQMYVPGYGMGTVDDRGGAINGSHIDVWFPSTSAAIGWGRQYLNVTVYR